MGSLRGKIDFVVLVSATNANPNGDPLNGNRPREDVEGFGEMSDVCIKRKIRNRWQDMGADIFVQSDDRSNDGCKSLKERADSCKPLKAEFDRKKSADRDKCAELACRQWMDVRSFGQVFAFKGVEVSLGIRGRYPYIRRSAWTRWTSSVCRLPKVSTARREKRERHPTPWGQSTESALACMW